MYGNPGDYFFHYTTRDAAFEHILPEHRLRLSPYSKMRDPLEAKGPTLGAGFAVPDDPAVESAMQAAYFEAWQAVATARGCTKLLSLTVDAPSYVGVAEIFGRGWARARMWEQYSENHRGVCLLFHRRRFQDVVLPQLQARDPGARCGPVWYTKEGLAAEAGSSMSLDAESTAEQLAERHLRQHMEALFFLKIADWESEHEFRFIEPSRDDDYSYVDFEDTLAAVMVGQEFPEWQVPAARESCTRMNADVRQVSWQHMNRPMPLKLV